MRRVQKLLLFVAPLFALLVFADPALAVTHGGEGLFGATNDAEITNAMFLLLGLFPVIIICLSLFQGFLDHRKEKKIEDDKAAAAANPAKGGW